MTAPAFERPEDRCGWPAAILFDLDGTLVDSAPDLAASVNIILARHGLAALPVNQVRTMIGAGVKKLVERAFAASGMPLAGDALDAEATRMLTVYGEHLVESTSLMPGAAEVVAAYHEAGTKLGLVTNKPQALSERIIEHFGLSARFEAIVGGREGLEKKPSPASLLLALEGLGVAPSRALMVGDSETDVATARAAGIAVIVVEGGYSMVPAAQLGADAVIATLADLPGGIEALKQPA